MCSEKKQIKSAPGIRRRAGIIRRPFHLEGGLEPPLLLMVIFSKLGRFRETKKKKKKKVSQKLVKESIELYT